uniref:Uncharacterized protein n=1 Tax=Trypanosoma congolense (strain IL3000) TaxID=1068625 RepID=G0UVT5_TRYCI|nr:conserved hypothetical protein [Trypanosoma congolense IL3000]
MRYFSSGVDRDSYASGVRPGGQQPMMHDVSKRRDNLPDNVFAYIRDQVLMEERVRMVNEDLRARARLVQASGAHGKRIAGGFAGDERRELQRVADAESTNARHRALLELYTLDMERWRSELAQRGLSAEF